MNDIFALLKKPRSVVLQMIICFIVAIVVIIITNLFDVDM